MAVTSRELYLTPASHGPEHPNVFKRAARARHE
ncbi:MAG: hypothetical protein BWX86_02891 [Verrucomicrobia bacterium ADurb.Bin122]|nr:MAG: hypothetical protein BWX86_02891 [Verrucomicrobia bacterium ADurb.Bin122]